MSDELTALPKGWEWTKIADIAEKVGSGATPRGGSESYKLSGIPLIRSMNVHFDGLKPDGLAYLDDKQADELKNVEVKTSDVLLNITGASIGRVTQAPPEVDGARVNQHVCIIRPNPNLDAAFLSKYLASPGVQKWIMAEEYGATRQALTKQMILNFDIPLPPLNEQKRIVAKIEELRDRHQAAKQALEAVPKLCDRFRQSVLAAAFRGDLTADWREENPDVEPASVLLERTSKELGQDFKQTTEKIDRDSQPLPETWAWAKFKLFVKGIQAGKNFSCPEVPVTGDTVGLVKISAVTWGKFNPQETKTVDDLSKVDPNLFIQQGDFLISRANTIELVGASVVVDEINHRIMLSDKVWRVDFLEIDKRLINFYLKSLYGRQEIESRATGNQLSMRNISQNAFKDIVIALPPLREQQEIANQIESIFHSIDRVLAQYNNTRSHLDELNQAILAKAFRGELVEQDPNDEPASVLLDRIRAEREAAQGNKKKRSTKGKRKKAKDDQLDLPGLESES